MNQSSPFKSSVSKETWLKKALKWNWHTWCPAWCSPRGTGTWPRCRDRRLSACLFPSWKHISVYVNFHPAAGLRKKIAKARQFRAGAVLRCSFSFCSLTCRSCGSCSLSAWRGRPALRSSSWSWEPAGRRRAGQGWSRPWCNFFLLPLSLSASVNLRYFTLPANG